MQRATEETSSIPGYIEERIRRDVPANCHVVPGSTPVVSFGNAQTATAATLGLNPSRVEFLDGNGRELVGKSRRLATLAFLGFSKLSNAKTESVCKVLEECNNYFQLQRNPYRKWFDPLDGILKQCGKSYYDGSACHLDLVQWATDPTWSRLKPASVRKKLLEDDAPFLVQQLQSENIQLLLVNGITAWRQLRRSTSIEFQEVPRIEGLRHEDTRLFNGTAMGRVRVVAWSTNLQSSFGVSAEFLAALAKRVGEMVNGSQ